MGACKSRRNRNNWGKIGAKLADSSMQAEIDACWKEIEKERESSMVLENQTQVHKGLYGDTFPALPAKAESLASWSPEIILTTIPSSR